MPVKLMTVKELSQQIQFAPQTIYNKIHTGEFVLNIHYYKPSSKKILFIWSAIEEWLKGEKVNGDLDSKDLDETNNISSTSADSVPSENRIHI